MDDGEKLNETSVPEKEYFYSNLNMGNITGGDSKHVKKIWKNFGINNRDE